MWKKNWNVEKSIPQHVRKNVVACLRTEKLGKKDKSSMLWHVKPCSVACEMQELCMSGHASYRKTYRIKYATACEIVCHGMSFESKKKKIRVVLVM